MSKLKQLGTTWLAIAAMLFNGSLSYAKPSLGAVGGGGARPGGGMSRPGGGGGMSRPSMPQMSRPSPSMSRPSMPSGNFSRPSSNISRPSTPNLSRPSMPTVSNKPKLPSNPSLGSRPSLGGFQPGVSAKPNFPTNKPTLPGGGNIGTTRPGPGNIGATRPSLKPPGDLKPITRPGGPTTLPGGSGNLPSIAKPFPGGTNPLPGITKPGTKPSLPGGPGDIATRPTLPGVTKPTLPGTKPNLPGGISTLPSNRPGFGNIDRPVTLPGKPGTGTLPGKPGPGDLTRPTPLPQPIIPGGGDRPSLKPDRPQIGGGGNWNGNRPGTNRPGTDRPWIGGGNNNNIGNNIINNNNNFINNNNNININNWNRPGWGVGGGNWNNGNWNNNYWHDHWHNNYVNNHYHGWYHGCWNGHYGNYWYAPWVVGVSAWGLGSWGWGYGTSYYNPYYIAAATPIYNYSQPVVVQNYYTTDDTGEQVAAAPQPTPAQLQPFDEGLAKFKAADYPGALVKFDQALRDIPNDPVIHEVRALTLFALGRYQEAGAALNALLATSPGMDWTTMSGLYGDPAAYTGQLRKLEDYCRANKDDAAAMFALTYHYLVIGQQESAITVLKHIVKIQPKDVVAARMLKSLEPDQPAADPAVVAKPAVQDPAGHAPPVQDPAANAAPQTDLVGKWQATAGKTTITLTITEEFAYTWEAATADQKPVKLEGQITTSPEAMILSNAQQGDMMGKVKSLGPDKFDFTIAGTPPGEPGLSFSRVK